MAGIYPHQDAALTVSRGGTAKKPAIEKKSSREGRTLIAHVRKHNIILNVRTTHAGETQPLCSPEQLKRLAVLATARLP